MRLRTGVGVVVTLVIVLALVLALSIAARAQAATVTDLGANFVPLGLNSKDQVVGDIAPNSGNPTPAAFFGNALTMLPMQPGGDQGDAYSISESGVIAGDDKVPSAAGGDVHAVYWSAPGTGAPTQLNPFITPTQDFSQATGVDNAGEIVGSFVNEGATNPYRGFITKGGSPTVVGTANIPPSSGSSFAAAITADGSKILGSVTSTNPQVYYLWSGASPGAAGTALDLTPGVDGALGFIGSTYRPPIENDLASDGTVLGYKGSGQTRTHYIRLPGGAETQIMGLTATNAVNAQHVVAGTIATGNPNDLVHAAIWRAGAVTDLNTLLPANSGFILFDAFAINDNGDIVGFAAHNNQTVGFLLKLGIEAENVEITQGIQKDSWDTPTTVDVPRYGATNGGSYSGVPLVKDVPTVVRVYASAPAGVQQPSQGVAAELHAYVGQPGALTELAGSPISASPRTLAAGPALPQARLDPAGAYTFTLPVAWTEKGPLTLVADVNPAAAGTPPCTSCSSVYTLAGIGFKTTGTVTVRPFRIIYKYPTASGHGFTMVQGADLSSEYRRARELLPLAAGGLVVQPYPQAVLDISAQVQRVVRFWRATNHVALSKADLSDCVVIPVCRGDIEDREYEAIDQSMTLSHTGHTYLAGFQPGIDGATWTAKGVTIIGGASQPPRPLTSTAHELLHLIGFKHAGQACPGTGVGAGQQGVAWPPDNKGYIQGVGLDRRPNSGGAGVYKIVAPGVGQPQWYDLMSYCANFDADAWLSTVNWTRFVATDPAPTAPAPDKPLATPAAAGMITVDAALITGGTPTLLGASSTTSPATRSTSSPYHIKVLGSGGHVIANVGVSPQQIDDSPLEMLTATMPGAGATTLELTSGAHVIAKLRKPTPGPSVRLTVPHGGLKVAHHQLTIRWRAKGARGATLIATIQYLASAKLGYQTLAAGITAGSYSVPISMFNHATRVHARVVISDGFSDAVVTSGLIRLPRR